MNFSHSDTPGACEDLRDFSPHEIDLHDNLVIMNVHHLRPGSVHYPQMERQDLTQSQLGSFKFVPTDATSSFYPQNLSLFLEHNLIGPKQQENLVSKPYIDLDHPRHLRNHSMSQQSPLLKSLVPVNSLHADHSTLIPLPYSNMATHWKPDDPVMRSGNLSPRRFDQRLIRSIADQPHDYCWPEELQYRSNDTHHSPRKSTVPVGYQESIPESRQSEAEAIQASLIRALSAEQEAHSFTKAEFVRLQARFAGLEARLESTASQNRSLLGSVNMLKSLVQHSVNKERSPDTNLALQPLRQVAAYPASTKAPRNATEESTLLHDAMERQKQRYKHQRRQWDDVPSLHNEDMGFVSSSSKDREAKNLDLELAPTHTIEKRDGLKDVRSRRPSSTDSAGQDSAPSKLSSQISKCTEVSMIPDQAMILKTSHTAQDVCRSIDVWQGAAEEEPKEPQVLSFLGTTVHKNRELSFDTCSPSSSECSIRPLRDGSDLDTSQANRTRLISKAVSGNKFVPMPYDPDIQWTIDELNPIFEDEADKYNRLGPPSKGEFRDTYFWEHPVRYTPEQNQKNLYRTVMIDFLPEGTEYFDLLEIIRGGSLESIQLFDQLPGCTTFKTARVVFNYELGARTVYMRGQNPGIFVKGQRLRVWQVLQPTYPKNQKLELDVFERGCTRLLIMDNVSHETVLKLPQKLKTLIKAGFLVEIARTAHGGLPVIEFTSVESAVKAFEDLMHDTDFTGVSFDFEPDQCEEPYETEEVIHAG